LTVGLSLKTLHMCGILSVTLRITRVLTPNDKALSYFSSVGTVIPLSFLFPLVLVLMTLLTYVKNRNFGSFRHLPNSLSFYVVILLGLSRLEICDSSLKQITVPKFYCILWSLSFVDRSLYIFFQRLKICEVKATSCHIERHYCL